MRTIGELWLLWGKTGGDGAWHPALAHILDVGAVAEILTRHFAKRLAELLNLDQDMAARLAAFLIASHDIGKLFAGFQQKAIPFEGWTLPPGLPRVPEAKSVGFDHGLESVIALDRWLSSKLGGDRKARALARVLARCVGAHHGSFHCEAEVNCYRTDLDYATARRTGWASAQDTALDWLWRIFVGEQEVPFATPRNVSTLAMWLAGLTTWSDWLGSNALAFPLTCGSFSPEAYPSAARDQASRLVDALRVLEGSPLARVGTFEGMFGFAPRPLQEVVAGLDLSRPGLLIVEAPMGEGKTEAAIYAAAGFQSPNSQGISVHLPTQATSNAMHRRMVRALRRLDPDHPRVALAHSAAALFPHSRPNTPGEKPNAEGFFVPRKRALLATHAVSTVDQLEMGGMRVKHGFVRLMGLANKPIVVDEAHAYDEYMSAIIRRTLRWLGEMQVPVVILSATLPSRVRARLVAAYTGRPCPELPTAYPLVTLARPGEPIETICPAPSGRSLEVSLELRVVGERAVDMGVARALLEGIAQGGCAAWIVNTVGEAQEAYRLVRELAGDDTEVLLFTSRFRMADRRRLERGVLRRFGPDGKRPHRSILIATQVVEQSLDLDFDLMVSHVAPIDLILQRLGRMHRHDRLRPLGLGNPRLILTCPEERGEETRWGPTRYVYDTTVLRLTLAALRERTSIAIPVDIRELVETVYSQIPEDHWIGEENQALGRILPLPHPTQPAFDGMVITFENDEEGRRWIDARTRLGRDSRDLILLHRLAGELFLDADCRRRVDLDVPRLNDRLARRLALRAVRVDHRDLIRRLDELETPQSISEHPLLTRHKLLVLEGGRAEIGRLIVMYESLLGLDIRVRGDV
jgi:CRISPR-associated endonuclease/helicase Cas3